MISLSLTDDDSDLFIASDKGWPVIDVGGIESARWLEDFEFCLCGVTALHRTDPPCLQTRWQVKTKNGPPTE
jgi:hypothetical protein